MYTIYSYIWPRGRCQVCTHAVCCSVLQCVALCCSVLQCVAVCFNVLQCVAVCCSVLKCAAVCCSVLQCAAVCCSVLQCVTVCRKYAVCIKIHCNTLQHTATHAQQTATYCNTLQHTATHCNTSLPAKGAGVATYCNTLQHTATCCNALQHTCQLQHHPCGSKTSDSHEGRKQGCGRSQRSGNSRCATVY